MNFPRQRLPYVTEFQLNNNKIKLIILQVNNFKKELPQLEPTKLIIIIIIIHRIKVSRISESTIDKNPRIDGWVRPIFRSFSITFIIRAGTKKSYLLDCATLTANVSRGSGIGVRVIASNLLHRP